MPTAGEPFGTVRGRALYLPAGGTLVVADLHLGLVATASVDAPLDEGSAIIGRLGDLLDRFEPETVVFAGDTFHSYRRVPKAARETLSSVSELVEGAEASLVLLEGNHDAQLAETADQPLQETHRLPDGTVVCHGHERPPETGDRYVIGHDHPTIEIEGRRRPCFLFGPTVDSDADVMVLPAFNPAVRGTAVNRWTDGDALSPFLSGVSAFRPIVWDPEADEPLVFPQLATLKPYL